MMSSTVVALSTISMRTPVAAIWSSAVSGPVSSSIRINVGRTASSASTLMSWAVVTMGRASASAIVLEMSRATTRSPAPSANTASVRPAVRVTMRSPDVSRVVSELEHPAATTTAAMIDDTKRFMNRGSSGLV